MRGPILISYFVLPLRRTPARRTDIPYAMYRILAARSILAAWAGYRPLSPKPAASTHTKNRNLRGNMPSAGLLRTLADIYVVGPPGLEPGTKGFALPGGFPPERTISPPSARLSARRSGAGRSSLSSRALQPPGSLCTFRRCTAGLAQDCRRPDMPRSDRGAAAAAGSLNSSRFHPRITPRRHLSMSPLL